MGNNVSMNNVKNHLNDEINSSDPQRLKVTQNMGLDSVTLHPKKNSNKKAFSNPNFDSDYKYLIGLGAPEETVQFMDDIKIKRTEQQQKQVDTLKSRYNNITNAIKMYQQDEKQIWLNLNVAKDPDYMKKRQAFLIHQKIKRLRNQRDKVIGELSNKYENASLIEENSKQLDFRNKNLIKTQQEIINKTNNEIDMIDSNIMTQRRQYQIDIYEYNNNLNNILLVRTVYLGTLFVMIPLLLSLSGIELLNDQFVGIKMVNILVVSIIVLFLIILISLYLNHRKTNKLDWSIQNFDKKDTGILGLG